MENYKIQFLPYSPNSKVQCPKCGKKKVFTLFTNIETGEIFPPIYGVCDRVESCGHEARPEGSNKTTTDYVPKPPKPVDYLEYRHIQERMDHVGRNDFFVWLKKTVGVAKFEDLKQMYRLGTSLKHRGFVSFPQIDTKGRVCHIKEMGYSDTGNRLRFDKSQRWTFEKWEYPDINLKQVYFGLHLLEGNTKPIGIVESEKTAIIASAFIKDYVWISTGSLGMLSNERCKPLAGRKVVLFPDVGEAFQAWKKKARHIKGLESLTVSDYLEDKGLKEGQDLADLILKTL